jgi:hypothetical protein
MRKRVMTMTWMATLAAISALPALCHAQMPGPQSSSAKNDASAPADPHDLSGMWEFFNGVPGQGIYATPSKDHPPMTPWALAKYGEAKPGYGPKAQAGGNDPILKCYPTGIPRILFFPQPFEIVQTPARSFMFFERDHGWRQIWTDGRSHPKDLAPTWMGDSVGKWDGDTFVVDTIGLTEKSWLDFYGDPHSDDIHLVERFKRVDHDTLTLQLIVEDPKAYTATWVGDTKIYKLLKGKKAYMEELPCIPEEEDAFTNRIRMPAASQTPKQ